MYMPINSNENPTKEEVLEHVRCLIEDCKTFEYWDIEDPEHWADMEYYLERVQKYIQNTQDSEKL